ncbi:hypothetical protein [Saccharothrix texasensis]|uniref:Nitroreductase family protein n=1 Tax=Saccharothrix texasensis TaxID=103734 RepID=A0A3N1H077_9PSEU|nr:hypothetical protein [Saccharothrix texasensis]ROP35951.1 hypothetical protein EDD40_1210 [Saccharothrix texasensis]
MTADALLAAYTHGPGRVVEPGTSPRTAAPHGPCVPLTALRGRFGAALARLLTDVATPLRWEPWNQYNDHRAYPSARAAATVDLVLDGRWTLDPVRRALVGDGTPVVDGPARIGLVRRRDRLSPGYREFGDVLTELEVGHVAAALVEHAARLGLAASVSGLTVTVTFGGTPAAGPAPVPVRGSGVGPRGVAADPRPLPARVLHAVVEAVNDPPAGSPVRDDLRHRLAVRNVEGVADGWYDVTGGLRLVSPGPAVAGLRPVFGHPPGTIDVASMNLALVTTGDPAAAVASDGPDGYRALLRAAGATAQHVCTAAAAGGAFCRPARSTDDGPLEAAVGAPASHALLYLLLAGRTRGNGFTYDLTPLEAR